MKRLRRYLVAGILVWAPLAVTFLLLRFAVNLMDKTLRVIPQQYRPEALLGFHIPVLGMILTFLVLLLTGMLAANFVGRYVVGGWESLLDRIPVVRSIYSAAKNFAEIVFSDSEHSFKRVLLIEYPRKGIYSLKDLRTLMRAANDRYLAFMACLDNPDAAQKALAKMAAPAKVKGRSFRGFDLFLDPDYQLFLTLARGEWSISGFRARDLRRHIPGLTTGRASYLIKRLRTHGLIKKVAHTYKYFFTKLGRRVVVTALVIRKSSSSRCRRFWRPDPRRMS